MASDGRMFLSGFVMLTVSYFFGQSVNPFQIDAPSWFALAYLVVVGSIISYGAYVYAINHLPPSRASIYAYINPIIAVFLGWLVFA
jgi:drug/metabolite transporter (DMT)-like permease